MKQIFKLAPAKFEVITQETGTKLLLDFNPVIKQFKLAGNYFLIHWQARPKGYREWGVYNSVNDTYTSMFQLPKAFGSMEYLMLDDKSANSIPSAVILFKGLLQI